MGHRPNPGLVDLLHSHARDCQTRERLRRCQTARGDIEVHEVRVDAFLGKLDAGGIQTLMRSADNDRISLALKGASEPVRDLFFSNISVRAAKIMREDMQAMGPVRLRDVDEAQMYLVQLAKDLAARNEIVIADAKGEDELVY